MDTPIVIQLNFIEFQQGEAVGLQILTTVLPQAFTGFLLFPVLFTGTGNQLKTYLSKIAHLMKTLSGEDDNCLLLLIMGQYMH